MGGEAGAEEGGLVRAYVWVHVYLHEVCQQVCTGAAGVSANPRSTRRARKSTPGERGPHCDMVIQRCLRRWISY